MVKPWMRHLSLIIIALYLSACASTTTMQPLNVKSAANLNEVKLEETREYEIRFIDGTSHWTYGSGIRLYPEVVQAYSFELDKWNQYAMPKVEDIYLKVVDKEKIQKRKYWATGMAVLAAFVAATAGGYFIQKEIR
jgi:hypothetical protein